jgi:hypothetical protein
MSGHATKRKDRKAAKKQTPRPLEEVALEA